MKKLLIVLGILLAISCGTTKIVETPPEAEIPAPPPPPQNSEPNGPDGVIGSVDKGIKATYNSIQFTNEKRVRELMNFMASDELKGREAGSKGIEKAADFIINDLESFGAEPFFSSYKDTLSNYKPTSYNVVGMLEGTDDTLKDKFILIGAHYDHIGLTDPVRGDAIANGANDNASGSTTILEIARYFAENKSNKRSLIFAWFSAEEKGLLGSKHLAERLKKEGLDLYTMLNFEMVGVPLKGKDYFMYITGYEMSNLAQVCNSYSGGKLIGFLPTAKSYNLFKRSDNYPFAQEFEVPAHTFCTFDFTNFDYYHKPDDELSEMDFGHMVEVINKSLPVIEGIANSPSQEIKMK